MDISPLYGTIMKKMHDHINVTSRTTFHCQRMELHPLTHNFDRNIIQADRNKDEKLLWFIIFIKNSISLENAINELNLFPRSK